MRHLMPSILLALPLLSGAALAGEAQPAHIGKYLTTLEDRRAIERVVEDFKAAIKARDVRALSSLLVNGNIPWASPASPERIRTVRETVDPHFDGEAAGGFQGFMRMLRTEKEPVEERFYNVRITQDGHVAWVMFDYEFVFDNKVTNYGLETWQMRKVLDGSWKIASVWWSSHPPK